jgi:hypothetical protein
MTDYFIKLALLLVVAGGLLYLLRFLKTRGSAQLSHGSSNFKIKDRLRVNFQNEIIVVDYSGREIVLLSSQGDMKQVFMNNVDFKSLTL